MKVPEDRRVQEPPLSQVVKVVFGWQAWIFFALICGSLGNEFIDVIRNRNSGMNNARKELQVLRKDVSDLQGEIKQLQSKIDRLLEDAN